MVSSFDSFLRLGRFPVRKGSAFPLATPILFGEANPLHPGGAASRNKAFSGLGSGPAAVAGNSTLVVVVFAALAFGASAHESKPGPTPPSGRKPWRHTLPLVTVCIPRRPATPPTASPRRSIRYLPRRWLSPSHSL